jgi:dTMP kinase
MDIRCADNLYDSFIAYQNCLIDQFDQMALEYNFITIDATRPVMNVFKQLKDIIQEKLFT